MTVTDVLEYLASGMSEDEILADFPDHAAQPMTCLRTGPPCGHPPKNVWPRIGNGPTSAVVALLRSRLADLLAFESDPLESILVLS